MKKKTESICNDYPNLAVDAQITKSWRPLSPTMLDSAEQMFETIKRLRKSALITETEFTELKNRIRSHIGLN